MFVCLIPEGSSSCPSPVADDLQLSQSPQLRGGLPASPTHAPVFNRLFPRPRQVSWCAFSWTPNTFTPSRTQISYLFNKIWIIFLIYIYILWWRGAICSVKILLWWHVAKYFDTSVGCWCWFSHSSSRSRGWENERCALSTGLLDSINRWGWASTLFVCSIGFHA